MRYVEKNGFVQQAENCIDKLDKVGKQKLAKEELQDEMLAISDTVGKWLKMHPVEPLLAGFAYMFKALEVADDKSPEIIKRDAMRISESLKQWIVGYRILKDSKIQNHKRSFTKIQCPKKVNNYVRFGFL